MSLARIMRSFGLACLLVLLPCAFLGADDPKPPEKVGEKPKEKPGDAAKPDKPQRDDTEAKGWNLHIRASLDISTDKAPVEDAAGKGDKTKAEDTGNKGDKAKAEDTGGPPTPERYAELLNSTSLLVRKRAALVLLTKGPDAYPALLELTLREKNSELQLLLIDRVAGDKVYSTPEKIGALAKVLKDPSAAVARRQAACRALPAMASASVAKPQLPQVKEALEFALADANEDLQTSAAKALEEIEDPAGYKARLTKRTDVRLALDAEALTALRLSPDAVLQAIRKAYPRADARLSDDVIQLTVTEDERMALVDRLRLPANGDVRVKDVVLKRKVAADGEKSSADQGWSAGREGRTI